jgi:hypothetical protein
MNWDLLLKAIKLAIRGRLWLLPIDCREEAALSINKENSVMLLYPELKDLDKNEKAMEATVIGHYMIHAVVNMATKPGEQAFKKWLESWIGREKTKKGKNK